MSLVITNAGAPLNFSARQAELKFEREALRSFDDYAKAIANRSSDHGHYGADERLKSSD